MRWAIYNWRKRHFAVFSLVLITLFFLSGNANAAVTYVQSASNSIGGVSLISVSFPSNNASGNLIIACARWSGTGSNTATANVSDTSGNIFTSFPNEPVTLNLSGAVGGAECWYAPNIKSGANRVTVTLSTAVNVYATVLEYSGAAAISPFDAEAHATGTNNAPSSGTATTAVAGDLLIGYGGAINDSGDTRTAGTGFIVRQNRGFLAEDQATGAAGSYSANMSLAYGGVINWIMISGSFKPATLDTTPPTVSVTSPTSGQTVSGAIGVSANASDNVGVASVQFLLDGGNLGSPVTSSPYSVSWNTVTSANGSHTLAATATDVDGLQTTSAVVSVTVSNPIDSVPPTVSITAPTSGQSVTGPVTVSANAADDVAVASVQFLLDGGNLGSAVTSAPYSISWNTSATTNGTHVLSAIATDVGGLTTTSASVSVSVSNPTSITHIQSASGSGGGINSLSVSFNSSNALGNLIVACSRWSGTNANTATANVTDTGGNIYTSFPNEPVTISVSGAVGGAECWYAPNIKSGANRVTVTFSTAVNVYGSVLEYSGAATIAPFDVEAHAMGVNNAPNSAPATTSTGLDMLFGYGGAINDSGDGRKAGTGFTARQNSGFLAEDETTGAPGSYSANMSLAYGSVNWIMIMGSFKPSTPDTIPPTVSLTAPTSGQTLTGPVTVSANASDDVAVSSVQFLLDGANLGSAVTSAPYSIPWNTTNTANGTHTLSAIATDIGGLKTTSAGVSVTVNNPVDSAPPTVSITSPTGGQTVTGTVAVAASAADDVAVTSVQFFLDGSVLSPPLTAAPYSISWNTATVGNGTHTLTAIATDTAGFATASAGVLVTVSNTVSVVVPTNNWVNVIPKVMMLNGFNTGVFGTETWSDSCYDPLTKRMILLQDYFESPGRYPYTIYANTVWAFDAAAQTLSMLKVDNWYNSTPSLGYTTSPYPANTTDPTPPDREFFFTCVPDKNYLFLFAGANKGINGSQTQPDDTWTFNLGAQPGSTLMWTQLFPPAFPEAGLDHIWSSMAYDPSTRNVVIHWAHRLPYGVNHTWLFNIDSQTYTEVTSTPQPQFSEGGANAMDYDSKRKLVWLFGAGSNVYANGGNELWTFNTATQTWTQVFSVGGPPPNRIWHGFVYISKYDKFLLWGGTTSELTPNGLADTWLYDPQTTTWTQLTPPNSPPRINNANEFVYMIYDSANDVVILNSPQSATAGPSFWLFRYAP